MNQNRKQKSKTFDTAASNKLAHLALLADEDNNCEDDCPTSEEIAFFVEQQGEDNTILLHLSKCDTCYNEWKTLAEEYHLEQNVFTKTYKALGSLRYIKAIGSTLAIAASVMFFLIVPQDKIKEADISTTHLAKEKNESKTYEIALTPTTSTEPQVGEASPTIEGAMLDEEVSDQTLATKSKKAMPRASSRTQKREATSSDFMAEEKQIKPDFFTSITEQLTDFCKNTKSAPSMDELILQLEKAGTIQPTVLQQEQLEKLLVLLKESKIDEKDALCKSIDEILNKEI